MDLTQGYSFFNVSSLPALCGSIALIVTAVLASRWLVVSRGLAMVCGVLVFAASILNIFYYLADTFTGAGINAAVWFHLFSAFNVLGLTAFIAFIAVGVLLFSISIGAAIYVYRSATKTNGETEPTRWGSKVLLPALLFSACVVSPATGDIWRHIKGRAPILEIAEYEESIISVHPNKPPNFVYIYVESVEQTLLDETLFPGLMPGLKALQERSTVFTDVRQVWGTEWSAAGIVASHCGVPLTGPKGLWSWENRLSLDTPDFYSGATCMGDLLASRGYELSFMSGADLKFHGISSFLRTHNVKVVDLWSKTLERLLGVQVRNVPWSAWGVFDDTLFSAATKLIDESVAADRPFGIFIETADTHNPAGHRTPDCKEIKYRDGNDPILNSVACADHLISRFVRAAEGSAAYRNTVIIIASDHLMQRNTVTPRLSTGHRSNLFMVFDPRNPVRRFVDKPGSMLDVGPTLLAILGFESQLALGRDLLGSRPSLMTEFKDFSQQLESWKPYFRRLWEHPRIEEDIRFRAVEKVMAIGKRTIQYPAFITFDETLQTTVFQVLDGAFVKDVLGKVYEQSKETRSPFLWIDRCDRFMSLLAHVATTGPIHISDKQLENDHCLMLGTAGRDDHQVRPIESGSILSLSTLYSLFRFPALKRGVDRD